ncbi:MAG: glycine cleavage system aminomethyltransferase GcvT [Coriobacteriia bacterium]|nr:glycine cleavage system aminomethyltransferase GcvT [Coriobacteriia bacterium]
MSKDKNTGSTQEESLSRTPLYDEHLALAATMSPFAGFEMPLQYQGIVEENLATREQVGIFDVSHMATFRVSGEAAADFLQRMLTNDLEKIGDLGAAQYTLLLDTDGGIIDDLIVYNTGAEFMLIANASNRETVFEWLQQHLPAAGDDTAAAADEAADDSTEVTLYDESDRTALIAVQGPEALAVIKELATDADWQPPERFHISAIDLTGGARVLIARTGYTGEDGVELVMHKEDAPAVWRALLSFDNVTPVGLGARDTLRLEMGYHLYGSDMDRSRNPIEAALGWVCPAAKRGYIGQEAVAQARANGTAEKLVHLTVTGGIPRTGFPVFDGDEQIGTIASGSHSPALGTGIATAYVPARYSAEGTQLKVGIRKRKADATVVKPPFLKKDE